MSLMSIIFGRVHWAITNKVCQGYRFCLFLGFLLLFLRCGHFSFSLHYILCIFQDIVEHWLITENVDGFYIRNSAYMYEDYDMRNETKANIPATNEVLYFYTPFAPSLVFCMVFCGLFSFRASGYFGQRIISLVVKEVKHSPF